ncbi:unnamed protein product [Penicillium manginii]
MNDRDRRNPLPISTEETVQPATERQSTLPDTSNEEEVLAARLSSDPVSRLDLTRLVYRMESPMDAKIGSEFGRQIRLQTSIPDQPQAQQQRLYTVGQHVSGSYSHTDTGYR